MCSSDLSLNRTRNGVSAWPIVRPNGALLRNTGVFATPEDAFAANGATSRHDVNVARRKGLHGITTEDLVGVIVGNLAGCQFISRRRTVPTVGHETEGAICVRHDGFSLLQEFLHRAPGRIYGTGNANPSRRGRTMTIKVNGYYILTNKKGKGPPFLATLIK